MTFDRILSKLLQSKDLTRHETYAVFLELLKGNLSDAEAKSLLLLLAKKVETLDEVSGCIRAIRTLEPQIDLKIPGLMDTCGTGGDSSHSFNISTITAFIIAGAGGKVAKHGNKAITSKTGSSDLMTALGINLAAPQKIMIKAVREIGLGYFHAPFYHPVFKRVQPLRQALKVRTIFNLLGPLLNPFKLKAQLVGVANPDLMGLYAHILKNERVKALVCFSHAGMDELTSFGKSKFFHVGSSKIQSKNISPKTLGFQEGSKKDLAGGTPGQNKKTALLLLRNKLHGPLRDTLILNAGAGLWISGKARHLRQGIHSADQALSSGEAYRVLERLKELTQKS